MIVHLATGLFMGARNYEWLTPDEIESRIVTPARAGRLEYWATGHGHLAFTWARPGRDAMEQVFSGRTPDAGLWEEDGPLTWIVDMAASPDFPGVKVGRQLSWVLAEREIAREGEAVYYRRNGGACAGRIGRSVVRRMISIGGRG